jgi:hypothetical protein
MIEIESAICSLCETKDANKFFRDKRRCYFRCGTCELVFVPPIYFLSADEEKAKYDMHQNAPTHQGYRKFLGRMLEPMRERLAPDSHGLDFGSGPGPTLSVMFEEIGYTMTLYDPFYANEPAALKRQYDFITATEVVEHLRQPGKELDRLWACLKNKGSLGVMTKLAEGLEEFAGWHYKNDPTHVNFFSQKTFKWLADQWRANLTFVNKDIMLFYKKNDI